MYKLLMTIMMIVNILSATSVLNLNEKLSQEHTLMYNNLPPVEDSDRFLHEQKEKFLDFKNKFYIILTTYGLQDSVGLRLIHKHFKLSDAVGESQEVMSECFKHIDGEPSLVTLPLRLGSVAFAGSCPASWLFTKDDSTNYPFEFSNDNAVKTTREKISRTPNFMRDVRDLIIEYQFTELFSLAILKRDAMSAVDGSQHDLIERSSLQDGSVIQFVKKTDPDLQKAIQTSWAFGPKTVGCTPSSYCQDYGNIGGIDRHVKQSFHSRF
jgi:hypothetical protein